jgi:exosome complex component RRP46
LGVELPEKAALEIHVRPLAGVAGKLDFRNKSSPQLNKRSSLGVTERSLSSALRAAFRPAILLNAHPRTLIQVVLQSLSPPLQRRNGSQGSHLMVFDTNPSMTAALINAGSLAFLQAASVPLVGSIVAVAVGLKQGSQGKELILDPEDTEVPDLVGGGVFTFLFSRSHDGLNSTNLKESENKDALKGRIVWSSWDGVFDTKEYSRAEELARTAGAEILLSFRQIMSGTNDADSMAVD